MKNDEVEFHRRVKLDRSPSLIPHTTQRRLENGFRTAVSTMMCIICMHYWSWAGAITYISPTISPIATVLYVGLWIENFWKVIYATVVGSVLGVIVGLLWKHITAHIFVMFFCFTALNKCSAWDRLPKVIGGLALLIGALFPFITNGDVTGLYSLELLVSSILMPFVIAGLTYFVIPIPSFSFNAAQVNISITCRKLSAVVFALTRAFCSSEHMDIFNTEVEFLLTEAEESLELLSTLGKHARLETMLLCAPSTLPDCLTEFITIATKLLCELRGLRDALHAITLNKTQAKFVVHLRSPLCTLSQETDLMLGLVSLHFHDYWLISFLRFLNWPSMSLWFQNSFGFTQRDIDWREHVGRRRERARTLVGDEASAAQQHPDLPINLDYVDVDSSSSSSFFSSSTKISPIELDFISAMERSRLVRLKLMLHYQRTRLQYIWQKQLFEGSSTPAELDNVYKIGSSDVMSSDDEAEDEELDDKQAVAGGYEDVYAQVLREEIDRFSVQNFNPRASYIYRLLVVQELVVSMHKIFVVKGQSPKPLSQIGETLVYVKNYFRDSVVEIYSIAVAVIKAVRGSSSDLVSLLSPYIQPAKISASICLTTLFVTLPVLRSGHYGENGLWASLVITLVRQDSTASSFLQSYQRLEGTVIGALYAFTMFQFFKCSNYPSGSCSFEVSTPILVLWMGVCAYFREGSRHGYAALVAGLTPIVLFLGPTTGTVDGAWARIMMTFVGILVYLFVDNLVLPSRTDKNAHDGVVKCIEQTSSLFKNAASAVAVLIRLQASRKDKDVTPRDKSHSTSSSGTAAGNAGTSPSRKHSNAPPASSLESCVTSHSPLSSALEACEVPNGIFRVPSTDIDGGFELAEIRGSTAGDRKDVPEDEEAPPERPEAAVECDLYIQAATVCLDALTVDVKKQMDSLRMGVHEPEIWHRVFPLEAYMSLMEIFKRVTRHGRAVVNGTRGLCKVIVEMTSDHEDVEFHLEMFGYMSKHLLRISKRSDVALTLAIEALHKLYEKDDIDTDLSALVTLARSCDRLLVIVDDHFRNVYAKESRVRQMNPFFQVAFHNVFLAETDFVKSLSDLGKALHRVRDVETLTAV